MFLLLLAATIAVVAFASLVFSTLTYSLRDLSRVRLADYLEKHHKLDWLEPTLEQTNDLIFATATCRLIANMLIALTAFFWASRAIGNPGWAFAAACVVAVVVPLLFSVAIPHALAKYGAEQVVGSMVAPLHVLAIALRPLIWVMDAIDKTVRELVGGRIKTEPEQIEQEILSAVEEGQKEGIVDEEERDMIESVIQFRDTTAGQIMTPRPEVAAIEFDATLRDVKQAIEESGHSRIPVYNGSLDQIVGILYARDLLRHVGELSQKFDIRTAMRPPIYVPETKPLRDLLRDFRLQKVHIAIVLDEYGGTAGLVTIEDILEELIGDISDEHEPVEPPMFKQLDDHTSEADARIYIDELNRLTGLNLPEDDGYDTLGGYVSTALGRIPPAGTVFEANGVKFTVLEAEPQKVNRVKIEQTLQPAESGAGSGS